MTEHLRVMENSGEDSSENQETGWESVAKVEFNEKETTEPTSEQEKIAEEDDGRKAQQLAVLREKITKPKPVEELSEKDAAQEYMDLLLDLSSNFTSAEGRLSRAAKVDKDGNAQVSNRGYSNDRDMVEVLAKKAGYEMDWSDDSKKEGVTLQDFHYNNPYADRALAMKMADKILFAQQAWRDGGEAFGDAKQDVVAAEAALHEFQETDEKKSWLKKLLTSQKRKQERQSLERRLVSARAKLKGAEDRTHFGNRGIYDALNQAYSEDYGYGHHSLSYEHEQDKGYKEKANVEYNQRFFGYDDPERQAKVERALELRKKLNKNQKNSSWK